MLKAGVSTACLYPKVIEEALYDFALAGIEHVELFINSHSEIKRNFVLSMKDIMKRFDMTCSSIHPYTSEMEPMMLFSPYERRVNDMIEYYKSFFSAMQLLGASIFVVHGNKPFGTPDNNLYFERFQRLVEVGKSFGIYVTLENVARCTSSSLNFLKQFCDALGNDAFITLDIKQAVRSKENPFTILRELSSHIAHVHISDHGEYGDCLQIGKGHFAVKKFLKELSDVNPDCSVILELYRSGFSDVPDLANNYQVLNNMIK